jgi:hypothetical protein
MPTQEQQTRPDLPPQHLPFIAPPATPTPLPLLRFGTAKQKYAAAASQLTTRLRLGDRSHVDGRQRAAARGQEQRREQRGDARLRPSPRSSRLSRRHKSSWGTRPLRVIRPPPSSWRKGGGGSVGFTCVGALLGAKSEAHPRCAARHAKSGKQVRVLIRLKPSTVVDYQSCDIGDERGA